MSIRFDCPVCGKRIKSPDSAGGKKGKCPKCHTLVVVPQFSEAAVEDASSDENAVASDIQSGAAQVMTEAGDASPGTPPSDAAERRPSGGTAEARVERGPLFSPDHFGRAFQDAFDLQEEHIPPRLKDYIAGDERVIMAFSLSGVSCILSIVSVCFIPILLTLFSFLAAISVGAKALGGGIVFGGITVVMAFLVYLSWKNTGYVLTDRRVLGRRGIFNVRWVFLTRTLISSVEINTGLFDRLFGLERVTIRALNGVVQCRGVSADISRKMTKLIIEKHPAFVNGE